MSAEPTLFASLTDEELLARMYASKSRLSTLENELAIRLDRALVRLNARKELAEREAAMAQATRDNQQMGLYENP